MAWEPIEISEQDVHAFAEKALAFYSRLDDQGKAMAREIITRAGGAADPGPDHSEGGNAPERAVHRLTVMLLGVWEAGTTIAPLYSGDMPRTGGGTID